MRDQVSNLSEEQRAAALETTDPVLILAGPGSGKTKTLVGRLAHLMAPREAGGLGAEPDSIMMVTFTNRAAREMRERIDPLLQELAARAGEEETTGTSPWAGTFHSLSLRILRAEARAAGLENGFSILDDSDARAIADEMADQLAAQGQLQSFDKDRFFRNVELAKGQLLSSEFLQDMIERGEAFESSLDVLLDREFVSLFEAYQSELRRQNAVDFADLLNVVTRLFQTRPDRCARWRGRFRHFLVDEFQDVNRAQLRWLQTLTGGGKALAPEAIGWIEPLHAARVNRFIRPTLALVGDDDQSIYGFRGADSGVLREIRGRFQGLVVRRLQTSYRCQPSILEVGNKLAEKNPDRVGKTLVPGPGTSEARPVAFVDVRSIADEVELVATLIRKRRQNGSPYSQMAVLLRTRSLAKIFAKGLASKGLPVDESRSSELLKASEIKDILAFVSLIENPDNEIAFRRIANRPARGLGKASLEKARENARDKRIGLLQELDEVRRGELAAATYTAAFEKAVRGFLGLMADLRETIERRQLSAVEAVDLILDQTGYGLQLKRDALKAVGRMDPNDAVLREPIETVSREIEDWTRRAGDGTDHDGRDGAQAACRLHNVAALRQIASKSQRLADFAQECVLDPDADAGSREAVKVLTMHAAKGLEWDHVQLPAWGAGVMPHARAEREGDAGIEEERRLAYVAVTRARRTVVVSRAGEGYPGVRGSERPGAFFSELAQLPSIARHDRWGPPRRDAASAGSRMSDGRSSPAQPATV